jgi:hypothetical protein
MKRLYDIAHARAGDKGETSNIAVFCYKKEDYQLLVGWLSAERVKDFMGDLVLGAVDRYPVDSLCAINFVLHNTLRGGVTRSLALDPHGKSLSSALLAMPLDDSLNWQA